MSLNLKNFRFYYSSHSPKIIEDRNAKFIEEHQVSGSGSTQMVELEEKREPPLVPLYVGNMNANKTTNFFL